MGRSNNSFIKKLKAEKRKKKKKEKQLKKEERRSNATGGSLKEMIAFVDEHGNITSEPPEDMSQGEKIVTKEISQKDENTNTNN